MGRYDDVHVRAAEPDDDPGLPIKLNPCSNGEFVAPPPSAVVRETVRRARTDVERNARRIGMSRRRFLLSSMGAATTLAALAACSNEADQARDDGGSGGTFSLPPEAGTEPDAAYEALGGEQFVFDVQTHYLDATHEYPPSLGVLFPQAACDAGATGDPKACFSVDQYLDLLFNQSDTNMVILSALPFAGSPLSADVMARTIDLADRLCNDRRTMMQGEAHPSLGPIQGVLENMEELRRTTPMAAWKVYTHLGGPGWYLDDRDPQAPQVGQVFLDQVRALGPKLVAVHKGFALASNAPQYADPVDVGPAAVANRDISFVVYHSGYDVDGTEGPYDEANTKGIDRLVRSVTRAGIGPGGNVYAELGSTWRALMAKPDQAAHALGKLLVAFGEDNIVWGTDSIWYGAPQDQIQAFRAFEITPAFQERYGYPHLTAAAKAKILGLNSARLYGVEPVTTICRIDRDQIESARLASTDANRTFGPRTARQVAAVAAHDAAALGVS
jgi:hypothetical protein